MKDHASIAMFFTQHPFRSRRILSMTGACVADIILLATAALSSLRNPDLLALSLSGLSIIVLVAAWWVALRTQNSMHRIFVHGQIEKLEEGSVLDRVLQEFSSLIAVLSNAFVGFGLGLAAALLLHTSRR
jgi:hypothetical protein